MLAAAALAKHQSPAEAANDSADLAEAAAYGVASEAAAAEAEASLAAWKVLFGRLSSTGSEIAEEPPDVMLLRSALPEPSASVGALLRCSRMLWHCLRDRSALDAVTLAATATEKLLRGGDGGKSGVRTAGRERAAPRLGGGSQSANALRDGFA